MKTSAEIHTERNKKKLLRHRYKTTQYDPWGIALLAMLVVILVILALDIMG